MHAVLPHLHNRGTLLILDADPKPGLAWTSKKHVLSWLKEHEQFEWVLDCPYTETKKGWHFYFFCDTLPPLFPAVQKGMFAGLGDAAELFGGNNFVPGGGTGQVNRWVWEAKKRPLFNWSGEIPTYEYETVLKPLLDPVVAGFSAPLTPSLSGK